MGPEEENEISTIQDQNLEEFERGAYEGVGDKDITGESQQNRETEERISGVIPEGLEEESSEPDINIKELMDEDVEHTSGLNEEGMPAEELERETGIKAEDYLIDHLGYNPDADNYDILGDLSISQSEDSIKIIYALHPAEVSNEHLSLEEFDNHAVDNSIKKSESYFSHSQLRDGYLEVRFMYPEENWIEATEEAGDAIKELEDTLKQSHL